MIYTSKKEKCNYMSNKQNLIINVMLMELVEIKYFYLNYTHPFWKIIFMIDFLIFGCFKVKNFFGILSSGGRTL